MLFRNSFQTLHRYVEGSLVRVTNFAARLTKRHPVEVRGCHTLESRTRSGFGLSDASLSRHRVGTFTGKASSQSVVLGEAPCASLLIPQPSRGCTATKVAAPSYTYHLTLRLRPFLQSMDSTEAKYDARAVYPFQRGDWSGSARLTFQHHHLRDRYGFLIHPTIASALRIDDNGAQDLSTATDDEPLQILDFAAGNGVWALDLASRLSASRRTVQITCLDISKEQAPPSMTVPDNVSFGIHDVFDEVPERFLQQFDLVHVRLMQVALLKPGSGQTVARNLAKMLKPGGWMQWQETGSLTWSEVVSDGKAGLTVTGKASPEMEVMDKHLGLRKMTEWLEGLNLVMAE